MYGISVSNLTQISHCQPNDDFRWAHGILDSCTINIRKEFDLLFLPQTQPLVGVLSLGMAGVWNTSVARGHGHRASAMRATNPRFSNGRRNGQAALPLSPRSRLRPRARRSNLSP